eukprot:gene24865-biopygen19283
MVPAPLVRQPACSLIASANGTACPRVRLFVTFTWEEDHSAAQTSTQGGPHPWAPMIRSWFIDTLYSGGALPRDLQDEAGQQKIMRPKFARGLKLSNAEKIPHPLARVFGYGIIEARHMGIRQGHR